MGTWYAPQEQDVAKWVAEVGGVAMAKAMAKAVAAATAFQRHANHLAELTGITELEAQEQIVLANRTTPETLLQTAQRLVAAAATLSPQPTPGGAHRASQDP